MYEKFQWDSTSFSAAVSETRMGELDPLCLGDVYLLLVKHFLPTSSIVNINLELFVVTYW